MSMNVPESFAEIVATVWLLGVQTYTQKNATLENPMKHVSVSTVGVCQCMYQKSLRQCYKTPDD